MNKKYLIFLSLLSAVFVASCGRNDPESVEVVKVKRVKPYHSVIEGESVGSIAEKYCMKRAELIQLNKLEQPYQLYNGQKLVVIDRTQFIENNLTDVVQEHNVSQKIENEDTSPQMQSYQDKLNETPVDKIKIEKDSDMTPSNSMNDDSEIKTNIEDNQNSLENNPQPVSQEFGWPCENAKSSIKQKFGSNGVDGGIIIATSAGTPVKSFADGVVVMAGVPGGEAAAYGVTVVIKHSTKKLMSIYAHLQEAKVTKGQVIKVGDIIGKVGKTGTFAKQPQLYFEINNIAGKGRKAVDPEKMLSKLD